MRERGRTAEEARLELYDIMQAETDFEQKAEAALELGKEYLGVDNAHLTRIDETAGYWEAIISTDPPDGEFPKGMVLDFETTYCRRTVADGGSIAVADAPKQGWVDDPAYETHDLNCYHGTVLTVDGELFGTVCFVSKSPREQPFDESETLFAELIARLLEHELERRHREAETTRRANTVTVLSRVLRHNLRNDMTVVRGRVSQLSETLTNGDAQIDALYDDIDRIIQLSDKARTLESVVSTEFEKEPIELAPLLDRSIAAAKAEYPAATVTVEGTADLLVEAMSSLELALTEVIENALKHAGPAASVTITVETSGDHIDIKVTDDGPGLPRQERRVLAEGIETPLVHGSGLGLWMVYWIINSHEGAIDATVGEAGTTITMTIPRFEEESDFDAGDFAPLKRGVDRFRAVFEESFDAMIVVDDDRRIIDANEHAGALFELEAAEIRGRPLDEFILDTDALETAWTSLQSAGTEQGRMEILTAEKSIRTVEYSGTADVIPGQHLLIGRDITDRIERERELQQYEAIVENIADSAWVYDDEKQVTYVNQEALDRFGVEETEVIGEPLEQFEYLFDETDDFIEWYELVDAVISGKTDSGSLDVKFTLDGETKIMDLKVAQLHGSDHSGAVVIARDVTERIQQKETLRERTQRLEAIFNASPDPIMALDTDGTVLMWNQAAEDVLGWDASEVIGSPLQSLDMHDSDQLREFERNFERALEGKQFSDFEITRTSKSGEKLTFKASTAPLRDEQDTIEGVMAVLEVVDEDSTD